VQDSFAYFHRYLALMLLHEANIVYVFQSQYAHNIKWKDGNCIMKLKCSNNV
jgi:hypothetical protein